MRILRALLYVVTLLTAIAGVAATTPGAVAAHAYDGPVLAHSAADSASPLAPGSSSEVVGHDGTGTTPGLHCVAPNGLADDVFHYTKGEFVDSISANGLRPASYATLNRPGFVGGS